MTDLVGKQFGNYRLLRFLGRGSFADVYLGEHLRLNTQAAIKILRAQLADEDMGLFLNEARTVANLKHPNIVRVLDFDVEEGVPFLVMDYAPNGTLRKYYPRKTQLTPTRIVWYVKQVAAALQYAHDRKLIHRDIKPENMLLGLNYEVLLSDFGLVTIVQTTLHQQTLEQAGSPTYMAPEQIHGRPRPASDQYALGIVVYEWLSGSPPFEGSSIFELYSQHMFATPAPLRDKLPGISPDIEAVVQTALAKEPDQRFASVQAFANALEQAIVSSPSTTQPPAKIPPAFEPPNIAISALPDSESIDTPAPPQPSSKPAPAEPYAPPSSTPVSKSPIPQPQLRPRRPLSRRDLLKWGAVVLAGAAAIGTIATLAELNAHGPPVTPTPTPKRIPTPVPLGTTLNTYKGNQGNVYTVAWSPHEDRIASASSDGTAQVWDAFTGGHVLKYSLHKAEVKAVAWSPDGRYIASGSRDNTVRIWDATTGIDTLPSPYTGHSRAVRGIAWSRDGKFIASGSEDATVQVWDAATKQMLFSYQHQNWVLAVAWSPDGNYIASGSGDHTVQVWDIKTKSLINTYKNHKDEVRALAWAPDSTRIASGSFDTTVHIWNAISEADASFSPYHGHKDQIHAVAWSPDGTRLASGSGSNRNIDDTAQIWNANTGQHIYSYLHHSKEVWGVTWSPDNTHIASGSFDRTVQVWQAK